jgi:hypothetical protein
MFTRGHRKALLIIKIDLFYRILCIRIFRKQHSLFTNKFEYFKKVFEYVLNIRENSNTRIPECFLKNIREKIYFKKSDFWEKTRFLGKKSDFSDFSQKKSFGKKSNIYIFFQVSSPSKKFINILKNS